MLLKTLLVLISTLGSCCCGPDPAKVHLVGEIDNCMLLRSDTGTRILKIRNIVSGQHWNLQHRTFDNDSAWCPPKDRPTIPVNFEFVLKDGIWRKLLAGLEDYFLKNHTHATLLQKVFLHTSFERYGIPTPYLIACDASTSYTLEWAYLDEYTYGLSINESAPVLYDQRKHFQIDPLNVSLNVTIENEQGSLITWGPPPIITKRPPLLPPTCDLVPEHVYALGYRETATRPPNCRRTNLLAEATTLTRRRTDCGSEKCLFGDSREPVVFGDIDYKEQEVGHVRNLGDGDLTTSFWLADRSTQIPTNLIGGQFRGLGVTLPEPYVITKLMLYVKSVPSQKGWNLYIYRHGLEGTVTNCGELTQGTKMADFLQPMWAETDRCPYPWRDMRTIKLVHDDKRRRYELLEVVIEGYVQTEDEEDRTHPIGDVSHVELPEKTYPNRLSDDRLSFDAVLKPGGSERALDRALEIWVDFGRPRNISRIIVRPPPSTALSLFWYDRERNLLSEFDGLLEHAPAVSHVATIRIGNINGWPIKAIEFDSTRPSVIDMCRTGWHNVTNCIDCKDAWRTQPYCESCPPGRWGHDCSRYCHASDCQCSPKEGENCYRPCYSNNMTTDCDFRFLCESAIYTCALTGITAPSKLEKGCDNSVLEQEEEKKEKEEEDKDKDIWETFIIFATMVLVVGLLLVLMLGIVIAFFL